MLTASMIETTVDTLIEAVGELEDRLIDLSDRGFPILDPRRVNVQTRINELEKIIGKLNAAKRVL